MSLSTKPKRYRFPASIMSYAIWQYHRFNLSFRDVQEQLAFRGIEVSHETVRSWCIKFSRQFKDVLKKREGKISDKWHLDEMSLRINGEPFILWRAVDEHGSELDVFLQKRRNKKSAIRFLSRLLRSYPVPRVIVTDKLKSYNQPIKRMCPKTDHRSHKGLNNRVENAHQPTRRKGKSLIKFKSPKGTQLLLSLMGKVRNLFAVTVNRYKHKAPLRRLEFEAAKFIWNDAALGILSI
ncbi:MAG: IS6 family transposase [Alphaproteobacteria bacterium]|nr:IS6 family transposase [Alphaproteobacteria bacterium]